MISGRDSITVQGRKPMTAQGDEAGASDGTPALLLAHTVHFWKAQREGYLNEGKPALKLLNAGKTERISVAVLSTADFDRLLPATNAICPCQSRSKRAILAQNRQESGECRLIHP